MHPEIASPYVPPSSEIQAMETTFPEAGSGKRFLNLVIDRIAEMALAYMVGLIAVWLYENQINTVLLESLQTMSKGEEFVFGLVLWMVYYVATESFGGRTLGKLITGTKAVMKDGRRLTFGATLCRTLCRAIPFEPLSFLGSKGGWHDTMTNTKVVDLRAHPVPVHRGTAPYGARAGTPLPPQRPRPAMPPPVPARDS
jgi:uncharacterized RDD family membrane protein YckC